MTDHKYFDRDLSWLSFNGRILDEAGRADVPLLERVNFLAIFSSNLDEFYRVRIPVLAALDRLGKLKGPNADSLLAKARQTIQQQQERYGRIVSEQIITGLEANNVRLLIDQAIPEVIVDDVEDYFFSQVMAFLSPVDVSAGNDFFPENNSLYLLILLTDELNNERSMVVNIPSDKLPRFIKVVKHDITYIVLIDDVIRYNLDKLFKTAKVIGAWSFKITRDAELDLKDEYPGDLSEQIEVQLLKRDSGIATRFLYQPGMPLRTLFMLSDTWNIADESRVEGGTYHNLKDLFGLPVSIPELKYEQWPSIIFNPTDPRESVFERIEKHDQLINTPYQSYGTILRFFNEAALDPDVIEIYVTLYRVASDSRIVNALINAAKAGKKVMVLVELKARFDEANNLKWAKKMKSAGVDIIYSISALKVHAKVALVKRKTAKRTKYYGLLATGNFNESTASFYTDHILITANGDLLREIELLFIFLSRREKPKSPDLIKFDHLLVAQFNLQHRFFQLIDREIENAKAGKLASIKIKLNNLEEHKLIDKLYEASQAGVKIQLLVRSICSLRPGIIGLSENISVKRIVDRYLEHGRMFVFHNNGSPELYMGSADWMNRNIYRRIEVCFPVYDKLIRQELIDILDLQLQDNVQAVQLDENIRNVPLLKIAPLVRSQLQIYQYLKRKKTSA